MAQNKSQQQNTQEAPRVQSVVVETTGDFMKTDMTSNQAVEADRPCLVRRTSFIQMQLDNGQLRMVDDEPSADLTDAEIRDKWAKTGKFKGSKKVKNTPPEAGSDLAVSDIPTPVVVIPKGAPQQANESDDEFLARLDKEKADDKK